MITPNEITEKQFSTTSDGYNIDEVDEFLNAVADSYTALYKDNKELYRKMEILAAKIEDYRDEEDSIKTALITAQKLADQVTKEAKEKAEAAISESRRSAQQTVADAQQKAKSILEAEKEKASSVIGDAEKKANDAINGAKLVAQNIMNEAKKSSEEAISKAKQEKEFHEKLLKKLKEETASFKESVVSLYEEQLGKIKDMTSISFDEVQEIMKEKAQQEAENSAAQQENEAHFNEQEINARSESEINETAQPKEHILNELEPPVPSLNDQKQTEKEVSTAIDAFSADEITPVEENAAGVSEIYEEPEMEEASLDSYGFDKYSNVKREPITKEKISLIPPDDYEYDDDEEDSGKFKGFFKTRKDSFHSHFCGNIGCYFDFNLCKNRKRRD